MKQKNIDYDLLVKRLMEAGLSEPEIDLLISDLKANREEGLFTSSVTQYNDYFHLSRSDSDLLSKFVRDVNNSHRSSKPTNYEFPNGRVTAVEKDKNDRLEPVNVTKVKANSIFFCGTMTGDIEITQQTVGNSMSLLLGSTVDGADLLYLRSRVFINNASYDYTNIKEENNG